MHAFAKAGQLYIVFLKRSVSKAFFFQFKNKRRVNAMQVKGLDEMRKVSKYEVQQLLVFYRSKDALIMGIILLLFFQ
jgi:hypothetical protein